MIGKGTRSATEAAPDEVAPSQGAQPGKATLTGEPLPAELQQRFARSLGKSVSEVRVHTEDESAARLGARAYARGRDIHFAPGAYDPHSPEGQRLIAQEVAHTVQQGEPDQDVPLAVSSPSDDHEVEATAAAPKMVEGAAAPVTPTSGNLISRDTAPGAPANVDPVDAFKAALQKKVVSEKEVVGAWSAISTKTAVDEASVILVIEKLGAKAANKIRVEAGDKLTNGIVDAIVKQAKPKPGWHDELKAKSDEVVAAPDGDPRKKLTPVLMAKQNFGYKSELPPAPLNGSTLALGKPYPFALRDEAAVKAMKFGGYKDPATLAKTFHFHWRLIVDGDVFGGGSGNHELAPTGAPTSHEPQFAALTPTKLGGTKVQVEVTTLVADGIASTTKQAYDLTVMDAAKDPNGYFEAKFREDFKPVMQAENFKNLQPGQVATLFTPAQRTAILDYIDTKLVPVGLFTNSASNPANGPQRTLIAAHILTFGKVRTKDGDVDGITWAGANCGAWAEGVRVYAGVNAASGYGSNSVEQVGSPTGEKSYGSGGQPQAAGSNQSITGVDNLYAPSNAQLAKANAEKAAAVKAKDPVAIKAADEAIAAAKAARGDVKNDDVIKAKFAAGTSPRGANHQNMSANFLDTEIKPGDWVYIDNNGTEGHSVIFASWAGGMTNAKEPTDTNTEGMKAEDKEAIELEAANPRDVWYRTANVYNQPTAGGSYNTCKLGFPFSKSLGVNGVYAITHVNDDAKPASDAASLLDFKRDAAVIANDKILNDTKQNLDVLLVKKKLQGVVRGIYDGIGAKKRPDKAGGLTGGLSDPQKKIAEEILAGGATPQVDIANLVALGQKLAVIDITAGDPKHPDGILTTATGKWSAPFPPWNSDASIKKV